MNAKHNSAWLCFYAEVKRLAEEVDRRQQEQSLIDTTPILQPEQPPKAVIETAAR